MSNVEVYIGSLIEHGSERAVLEYVVRLLSDANRRAIILCNVELGGCQIDLVVALEELTLVAEAKGYRNAVRGDVNGPWQVRVASGGWKNIANLYGQTIKAAHALRDTMARFARADVPYPAAALVFTPDIPFGSQVHGDFKAVITGLTGIGPLLEATRSGQWSFDQWRAFTRHHRLIRVQDMQAAFDPLINDAERLIETYSAALRRTYAPLASDVIPFECRADSAPRSSDEIVDQGARGADFLVKGPSGCGKTLVAYRTALSCLDRGRVPIFVFAKNFEGNLRELVHREAVLLDAPSAEALVAACQRLRRPMTFIVDGYNECPEVRRGELTRYVAVAARRYEASVLVTTQTLLDRSELLTLTEINVPEPSVETKRAIAEHASGGSSRNASVETLLNSVSSGLEARLVGEAGRTIRPGASRYAIFDDYVRKRLGDDATEAVAALTGFAGLLSDRISFSLTVRDRDRFAEQEQISASLLRRLRETNLLVERGGRASFGHELFLNAFAAEAVVRRANGDALAIASALRLQQHADRRALIVGAIDDAELCVRVLTQVSDASLIRDCIANQCGQVARMWAERRCREVLERVGDEAKQVAFEISEKAFMDVRAMSSTLLEWTPQDRAVLAALPQLVAEGRHLDDILDIAKAVDGRLATEHQRLRATVGDRKIALRSGLFAACYVWNAQDAPAFAEISSPLHSGMIRTSRDPEVSASVRERLTRENLSHGQLYLLVSLYRHGGLDGPSIASLLPGIFARLWRGAAYHLRLDLMEATHSAAFRATDEERRNLIQAIEDRLPHETTIISTVMIDALKALGALDDSASEHTHVVRDNLRDVLSNPDDPAMQQLAFGTWYGQFDHPYDGAYCEAVNELSAEDRKTLLTMAAQGAELDSPFASILLVELARFNDPSAGPHLARWVSLPPTRCAMRQDAIGDFAVAHIALARLGCALPPLEGREQSDGADALGACGEILYWMNRVDLPIKRRRSACQGAVTVLRRNAGIASAGVLAEFRHASPLWSEGLSRLPGAEPVQISIGTLFPEFAVQVCRECLQHPDQQRGYFEWLDRHSTFDFALQGLGEWGDATDIPLLRAWSLMPNFGRPALDAIKQLEGAEIVAAQA